LPSSEPAIDNPSKLQPLVVSLYLLTLALLPWGWFPPFRWLHQNAQWSDVLFAFTALAWIAERWYQREPLRIRPTHAALALYFLCAVFSLLFASPDPAASIPKLLGIAELCALAFITSDLASRPRLSQHIGRVIAITGLVTAAASVTGLLLFYAGVESRLIGVYGELEPSGWYARVQAGTHNPNMLASFCIFAAAIASRRDSQLPGALRRITLGALWITVLLTFSRGILGFILASAIRNARTPARRMIAGVVAAALTLLMIAATLWRPVLNPANPLEVHVAEARSTRRQAATSSLRTLVTRPLFGSGVGTSPGTARGVPFDAHLTPLNVAATLGLPALMVFCFLISCLWRRRSRPTDLAIWSGLAGLALDGLAQDIEDFRHVWVIIGLADAGNQPKAIRLDQDGR
jgi:hypothetical protein